MIKRDFWVTIVYSFIEQTTNWQRRQSSWNDSITEWFENERLSVVKYAHSTTIRKQYTWGWLIEMQKKKKSLEQPDEQLKQFEIDKFTSSIIGNISSFKTKWVSSVIGQQQLPAPRPQNRPSKWIKDKQTNDGQDDEGCRKRSKQNRTTVDHTDAPYLHWSCWGRTSHLIIKETNKKPLTNNSIRWLRNCFDYLPLSLSVWLTNRLSSLNKRPPSSAKTNWASSKFNSGE